MNAMKLFIMHNKFNSLSRLKIGIKKEFKSMGFVGWVFSKYFMKPINGISTDSRWLILKTWLQLLCTM